MTLQYIDDTIGQVYTAPNAGASIDAYGLSSPALYGAASKTSSNARFNILNSEDLPDGSKRIFWRLEVYDLRQGFQQSGRWEEDYGNIANGTLSTTFQQQGVLPFLSTGDSTYNPSLGTSRYQMGVNVFGTLAIGLGNSGAQSYLFKETSTTNPVLTQITYAKGAAISAMTRITFSGTDYLVVCLQTAGADVLSNLTTGGPTSAFTMHANTAGTEGMIQTFLPNNPILIATSGAIFSLDSTLAPSTLPSTVLTNGFLVAYPLGLQSLGGSPVRAFWLTSATGTATQVQPGTINGANFRGAVASTAQDGSTPQRLSLPLYNVQHAAIYRDGIVASDENRVVFHNGRSIRDLRIFKDVPPDSDKLYKIAELYVSGPSLWAEVNIIASPSGTGNTKRAVWYYDYDVDAWFQVSAVQTLSSTGIQSFAGNGAVSEATGFLHTRALDAKFWRIFQPPYGVNPFSYRKTSGASASTGQEYEPSGFVTVCANELPGLEGMPKIIRSVQFMGDVDAGGTGGTPAKVNVTAPGVDTSVHTLGDFQTGNSGKLQRRDFEDNNTSFYKFQPTITVNRQSAGTDPTRFTPQFLPIAFEGVAYYRPWLAPAGRQEVNT